MKSLKASQEKAKRALDAKVSALRKLDQNYTRTEEIIEKSFADITEIPLCKVLYMPPLSFDRHQFRSFAYHIDLLSYLWVVVKMKASQHRPELRLYNTFIQVINIQ